MWAMWMATVAAAGQLEVQIEGPDHRTFVVEAEACEPIEVETQEPAAALEVTGWAAPVGEQRVFVRLDVDHEFVEGKERRRRKGSYGFSLPEGEPREVWTDGKEALIVTARGFGEVPSACTPPGLIRGEEERHVERRRQSTGERCRGSGCVHRAATEE